MRKYAFVLIFGTEAFLFGFPPMDKIMKLYLERI